MASDRSLRFSHSFVISCGTVTVDLVRSKLLLIHWHATGEYFLPKGRKDVGETLERTALHGTFEETGYKVELLPLTIQTRATGGSDTKAKNTSVTEPVAVQQRVTKEGILKIIFWFAAKGSLTEKREKGSQQEGEDFDAVWVRFEQASNILSFDDDKQIAEEVLMHVIDEAAEEKKH
ncbi:hypothetical protein AJ79_06944 [Helicocarpus griseus UAMH5409]|uniref:Nudix hydrolase domain-containing protein n=1 Tax=Helicocarpus griseus UAMH5409 TaxID=1447875 RepID=A0A2B7X8E6_9EURO|nr:hypothetical protein AJ79_06944 [Helicocarpus griseus UAMH5409]